jgi:hypothetical protein
MKRGVAQSPRSASDFMRSLWRGQGKILVKFHRAQDVTPYAAFLMLADFLLRKAATYSPHRPRFTGLFITRRAVHAGHRNVIHAEINT